MIDVRALRKTYRGGVEAVRAIVVIDAANLASSRITTRTPTLDDVYLRLTGDQMAEAA